MDVLITILADGVNSAIGPTAVVFALAAIGLNVHYGYTGLLNFGQVGFMLVGAYGLAITVSIWEQPLWVGVIAGILASTLLALLLGLPTLRLRADYLAISTIAAAEILRFVFRSSPATPFTGGPFGIPSQVGGSGYTQTWNALNPFPQGRYGIGWLTFSHTRLWATIVGWSIVLLVVLVVWLLMRSPWGRVLKSIREDEDAARALGKNVFAYKMQALILGGVLGGMAGMMLAISQAAIAPDQFLPQLTFFAYTVLIMGGAATIWGPVVGSLLFWFLIASVERALIISDVMPSGTIGPTRLAFVGILLVLLMAFRPQGLLGNKREMVLDG
ncbi:MAG: branched-chain amino acid ABC transporter permease [Nitriliruptoraceae bacterium]|nr:branched-chain amino acid ABC transporter permease [Nitriliruptoraceae bacterium]